MSISNDDKNDLPAGDNDQVRRECMMISYQARSQCQLIAGRHQNMSILGSQPWAAIKWMNIMVVESIALLPAVKIMTMGEDGSQSAQSGYDCYVTHRDSVNINFWSNHEAKKLKKYINTAQEAEV